MKKLDNYLKVYRKQSGLTQKEIATLLDKKSVAVISKIENGRSIPSLETAVYLSIIYRQPITELIPVLIEKWQFQILKNLDCMNTDLEQSTNTKNRAKKNYIERIINDIATTTSTN